MLTIKDIAKNLNMSVSTVSKALNNYHDVKEETKLRVLEECRRLNFTPNIVARSMINKKSYVVGLMIPDIADSFFSVNARGVEEVLVQHDHRVVYASTGRDPREEKRFLTSAVERRWDGVIITPDYFDEELIDMIQKMEIPVVLLRRRTPEGLNIPFVDADHYQGACTLTEYLISLGHTKIGFIHLSTSIGGKRFQGFIDTMSKHGLSVSEESVVIGGRSIEEGREAMGRLYAANPSLTAVFAANDILGIGALEYLAIHEIRVPEQISVVGFDNIEFTNLHWIQLTTMEQPRKEMGRVAAQLLLEMILKRDEQPESITLPTRLIERRSASFLKPQAY
ncbi:LacI family DNA-binding transcriptional regulator [Paenibacillus radicis (ex Xue et al. 2023)]|uniref:LacI family transcriptional regulator n=1 Tax=Paenibacillus radicis (ex Xue et al. 2023) TaxID=2972489 RepID=A0ABT1YHJ4_9BACL|nr:LacI family DNA-binding transcriptional regulator [Paenibacillus radicis (ex Xue et al. 2023)]MCR8632664.1 LacI family transcriptional regulator [Paenibacillus radicis (ex Xue et al. 2023)]